MSENPKYTIKKIIDDMMLKQDNEVDDATLIFLYEGGPETLEELIAAYDVIVTFGDPPVTPSRHIQDKPFHYSNVYPVTVTTYDKTGVTGTKMMHKARTQMRSLVEASAQGTGFTLRIRPSKPVNRDVGGIKLLQTTFQVEYKE